MERITNSEICATEMIRILRLFGIPFCIAADTPYEQIGNYFHVNPDIPRILSSASIIELYNRAKWPRKEEYVFSTVSANSCSAVDLTAIHNRVICPVFDIIKEHTIGYSEGYCILELHIISGIKVWRAHQFRDNKEVVRTEYCDDLAIFANDCGAITMFINQILAGPYICKTTIAISYKSKYTRACIDKLLLLEDLLFNDLAKTIVEYLINPKLVCGSELLR